MITNAHFRKYNVSLPVFLCMQGYVQMKLWLRLEQQHFLNGAIDTGLPWCHMQPFCAHGTPFWESNCMYRYGGCVDTHAPPQMHYTQYNAQGNGLPKWRRQELLLWWRQVKLACTIIWLHLHTYDAHAGTSPKCSIWPRARAQFHKPVYQ